MSKTGAGGSAATQPKKYLGDTGAVRKGLELDARRLSAYLTGRIPGFRGQFSVRQFDGGQSNPTYRLEAGGVAYVLRRRPPGVLLQSAHAVDREFKVMSALFAADFPVPEPLVLCTDEEVIGSQFYVMRFVSGRIFFDCSMPDLSGEQRSAVFDAVNATLARLHSFDPAAIGLEGFGRPGNYFARQISRWTRQYQASQTTDIPEMEKLMAWLPSAVPPDDGRTSIVHGDFSFHNILIAPDSAQVMAVIDWELSTLGHPLGDLTYHLMEWYRPSGVDLRGTLRDRNLKALGIPTMEEYASRYAERAGIGAIGSMAFYKSFNLFRIAAIVQGIAARQIGGNAASSNAADVATRVRPIAVAAWREAEEGGAT